MRFKPTDIILSHERKVYKHEAKLTMGVASACLGPEILGSSNYLGCDNLWNKNGPYSSLSICCLKTRFWGILDAF